MHMGKGTSPENELTRITKDLRARCASLQGAGERPALRLCIAGLRFGIFCEKAEPDLAGGLALGIHPSFLVADDEGMGCDYNISLTYSGQKIPFEAYTPPSRFTEDREMVFSSPFYIWVADPTNGTCAAAVSDAVLNVGPLTVLRGLIPPLLVSSGIFPLHAAGVLYEGKAVLFVGPSGAGKSTAARLSAPRVVLSDECILIRKENEISRAWGTPFGREAPGCNVSAPIRTLLALKKDSQDSLKPLPFPEVLGLIMKHPWISIIPKPSLPGLLDLAIDLVKEIPAYELHFRKDRTFWTVIEELL